MDIYKGRNKKTCRS